MKEIAIIKICEDRGRIRLFVSGITKNGYKGYSKPLGTNFKLLQEIRGE